MAVLDDIVSELPYFKTTWIHGYDDRLLTYYLEQLEPYAMLEIFWDVPDAVLELKDVQLENWDTLLGIGRALDITLESDAQEGSSIIKATEVLSKTRDIK